MRAMARISTGTPACGLPAVSSATAVRVSVFFTEIQLPARRPTTTADGHSGVLPEMVCTSPLGSL